MSSDRLAVPHLLGLLYCVACEVVLAFLFPLVPALGNGDGTGWQPLLLLLAFPVIGGLYLGIDRVSARALR